MPSPPEPIDLRVERPLEAPRARQPRSWLARPRMRGMLGGMLGRPARRHRAATTEAPPLSDLWNAWGFAELECAIALRAWRLAPRSEQREAHQAYCRALEREALLATELCVRSAA
jgi:hypothetical protein